MAAHFRIRFSRKLVFFIFNTILIFFMLLIVPLQVFAQDEVKPTPTDMLVVTKTAALIKTSTDIPDVIETGTEIPTETLTPTETVIVTPTETFSPTVLSDDVTFSEIIGNDDRVRVEATTSFPWRAIANLAIDFEKGSFSCTGFFIGPRTVVTAGHCLYSKTFGGKAKTVRIMPGRNGLTPLPFGSETVSESSIFVSNNYMLSEDSNFDYGAIILPDSTLGDKVGTFFTYGYYSDSFLSTLNIVNVAGYPGDKPIAAELWLDGGPLMHAGTNLISYRVDTAGGESGSPVWFFDGAWKVVGIHTLGYSSSNCYSGFNCGVRITDAVASDLQNWLAPTPETDCRRLNVDEIGNGTVDFSPTGSVGCPQGFLFHGYAAGTWVTLTAKPASGWSFSNWTGTSGGSTINYQIQDTTTLSAVFTQDAVAGDTTPPTASWSAPNNGDSISTCSVTLSANASDNTGGSGVKQVSFSGLWGGTWHSIGTDTSAPYSVTWDMCAANVPNGSVELGLEVKDNMDNKWVYSNYYSNYHITKNYSVASPAISSLNPNSTNTGSGNLTITVNGSNFRNDSSLTSIVRWNGNNLSTTFINSSTLTAIIPSSYLGSAGTANITVYNPQSGSYSGTQLFTINQITDGCYYVDDFSFSPASPSNGTTISIHSKIKTSFPNFRAARIKVDNSNNLGEFSSFEDLARSWQTSSYADGNHTLTLEIDDNQGSSWDNPQKCSRTYFLYARPQPGPASFNLSLPANGTSLAQSNTVILSWEANSITSSYVAHLWNGTNVDLQTSSQADTYWNVGRLSPGLYYWQVTAQNYSGSRTSATWSFTINQPPAGPIYYLTPSSGSYNVGDHIYITVNFDSAGQYIRLSDLESVVIFDKTRLRLNSIQNVSGLQQAGISPNRDQYIGLYYPTIWGECGTRAGQLAVLDFQAIAGGNVNLQFSWSGPGSTFDTTMYVCDNTYNPVLSTVVGSNLVISGAGPTAPAPSISTISPNLKKQGESAFSLRVDGSNFQANSKILWNGTEITTNYWNSTLLYGSVPATLLTTAGNATIKVNTPAPGGGITSGLTFTILPPPDTEKPIINWIAPVNNFQALSVSNQTVQLQVNATDNIGVTKVRFYRWDAVNSRYVEIGNDTSSPFQIGFDTSVLNNGANEIIAEAYDAAGNISASNYIWLYYQPPLPDLIPYPRGNAFAPVVFSNAPDNTNQDILLAGNTSFLDWGIKNVGQAEAGLSFVRIWIDDQLVFSFYNPILGAGEIGGFDDLAYTGYISPGIHTFTITVDSDSEITESDESNNTWSGIITVRPPSVYANGVFTTNDQGTSDLGLVSKSNDGEIQTQALKSTFAPGDEIGLYLDITNEFSTDQPISAEWEVTNPAGRIVTELSSSATTSIGSGGGWWPSFRTIPSNSVRGEYTFTGKVTYNGNTTIATSKFTVSGSPSVEVYDTFVTNSDGSLSSQEIGPKHSISSDLEGQSILNFNAGDGINLHITAFNDVAADDPATFKWEVLDSEGRYVGALQWEGVLNSYLGYEYWYLPATIPSNATTGDYVFTGYITYGDRTTQQSVTFHVNGPAGPTNDKITTPKVISSVPYNDQIDTWNATMASSDPTPSCGRGQNSNSVWYRYTPPASGILDVDTVGSDFDTIIALWKGSTNALSEVACGDDTEESIQSFIEKQVLAGTTYYIEVMEYGAPGGGGLNLNVNFKQAVVNDEISAPVTITSMPFSKTQDTGAATKAIDDPALTTCNRAPGLASVWYKFIPALTGEISLNTRGSNYDTLLAVWSGVRGSLTLEKCNDDIGDVDGNWDQDSELQTKLIAGKAYYIEVSRFNGVIDTSSASIRELGKPEITAQFDGGNLVLTGNYTVYPIPSIVTLVNPANGVFINDKPIPDFTWNSTVNGETYQIQIDNNNTFSSPEQDYITDTGVLSYLPTLTTEGLYYWRVRAISTNNILGGWSSVRTFTFDKTSPIAPSLLTPTDIAVVRGTPAYTWSIPTGAKTFQFEYDDNSDFSSPVYTSQILTTAKYIPPTQAFGLYYWHVKAADAAGNWSAWGTPRSITIQPLIPTAPVLTSPATGLITNNTLPQLTWNPVSYGDTYQVQLSRSSTFATLLTVPTLDPGILNTQVSTNGEGKYYWRVRAINVDGEQGSWSSSRYFTVDTIPQAIPSMTTPANGAVVLTTMPKLAVTAVSGANYYQYQVDDADDFTAPEVDVTRTTTTYTLLASQALRFGTHYWRVQSIDAAGNPSGWSSPHTFVVNILKKPANNSFSTITKPTFSWASAASALEYKIQVATDAVFGSETLVLNLNRPPSTSYTSTIALNPNIYYWRMQVRTVAGWGNWTPVSKFIVTPALPVAPVLNLPVSGYITNNPKPVLSWNAVATGVKYEIQVSKVTTFNPLEQTMVLDPDLYQYTTETLADGVHYWRVRALNSLGVPGAWSAYRSFRIDTTAPNVPVLSTPVDGASVNGMPKYVWLAASGTKYYQFQYTSDAACLVPVFTSAEITTLYLTPPTQASGTYYWCVRAKDVAGNWSNWSTSRKIIIQP